MTLNRYKTSYKKDNPGCLGVTFMIAFFILLVIAILGVVSLVAMFAWNLFIPAIGGPTLTYAQSFGGVLLLWLIATLFRRSNSINIDRS